MPRRGEKQSLEDRIERFSIPEPNSGCFLWTGGHETRGATFKNYGRIWVDGRTRPAHCVAWEVVNGPVPEDMCVCHKCDVPLCVNVDHLFLGTHKDNTQDMIQKGRNAPMIKTRQGVNSNWCKLTPQQVFMIREDPRNQRHIAAEFGITQTGVSRIKLRKTWRHL